MLGLGHKTTRPIRVTATGLARATRTRVSTYILTAGSAAASVTIRDGDATGPILIEFHGVPTGTSDGAAFAVPVLFRTSVHVTISGAGASLLLYCV